MTPQQFNEWRVVPRFLVFAYGLFFIYAWFYVVDWFKAIDWEPIESEAVALAIAGFPAAILFSITQVFGKIVDAYMNGKK